MKSYTKIRKIQESNKIAEKRFLAESFNSFEQTTINEGMWDKLKANTAGFFSRFKTFGQNIGSVFSGGDMINPALEAAYTRVRNRATTMQKELTDLEADLAVLYDEANKGKVQDRVDKLGKKERGQDIDRRLGDLEKAMYAYSQAIEQMKGINEGFIESVKSA